jgi:hypothetical protein
METEPPLSPLRPTNNDIADPSVVDNLVEHRANK